MKDGGRGKKPPVETKKSGKSPPGAALGKRGGGAKKRINQIEETRKGKWGHCRHTPEAKKEAGDFEKKEKKRETVNHRCVGKQQRDR